MSPKQQPTPNLLADATSAPTFAARHRWWFSLKVWFGFLAIAVIAITVSLSFRPFLRMKALQRYGERAECVFEPHPFDPLLDRMGAFGDGFRSVSRLSLHHTSPDEVRDLDRFLEISTLEITSRDPVEASGIPGLNHLSRLETLNLSYVTQAGLAKVLQQTPSVRYLNVRRTIENTNSAELARLQSPHLESLSIERSTCELLLGDVPALQELEILNCLASVLSGKSFAELPSDLPARTLLFDTLPSLRRIRINWQQFYAEHLILRDLRELEHLLVLNDQTTWGRWAKFDFSNCPNLRAIDIPGYSGIRAEQVEEISELPALEHLNISKCVLHPGELEPLMGVETLRLLRIRNEYYNDNGYAPHTGRWDFAQLRRDFPQQGLLIHGPFRRNETVEYWSR